MSADIFDPWDIKSLTVHGDGDHGSNSEALISKEPIVEILAVIVTTGYVIAELYRVM